MATFKKFEEIESWKEARQLCKMISVFAKKGGLSKDFELRGQIRKSSGSAMDNIAEGFGRGNKAEFCNFLGISNGSATEVQSQLYRCLDNEYINEEEFKEAYEKAEIVVRKNGKLIEYLNNSAIRGVRYRKNNNGSTHNDKQQTNNDTPSI